MTDSTHTDFTCSSCNTIATSLTECDHCRKWLCQSCSKLLKSTLNKMTALQKSGFYWFCTNCRTDSRPSQRKILSNSYSQTSPMSSPPIFNNHSPAPELPQLTFSTSSPLTPPPNPSSQTISGSIPQSPHNSSTVPTILTIPTRLSPVTTKRLQSITSIAKPPSFNNLHRSCIPPLLPHKSDKIAWKIINNLPNTPLINFLVGKLSTISHTIIGANETGNDRAYLKKLFASINIHSQPHIHSHRIPHSPNSSSNLPKPLSITYLDHHSKNTVIRLLHLLKNHPFKSGSVNPSTIPNLLLVKSAYPPSIT